MGADPGWLGSHRGELEQARDVLHGLIRGASATPAQYPLTAALADLQATAALITGYASPGVVNASSGRWTPYKDPGSIRTSEIRSAVGTLRLIHAGATDLQLTAGTMAALAATAGALQALAS